MPWSPQRRSAAGRPYPCSLDDRAEPFVPIDATDRFAAQTFRHDDFDLPGLLGRKRATGASVSVVVPAQDEEATVGSVVRTLLDALGTAGLIDELVVIDADSTDGTAAAAREAGARVARQSSILPEAGSRAGKGEALWKGLATTTGDLVVFVDADIVDIDPRFVSGLLGPLLADERIQLAKAAYDRPLAVDGNVAPTGGGRVTELLARPLIAAFWPELAWIAQPLSGEYAGRRTLLEQLPFVCGYGVEIAMLVDVFEQAGVDAIAQVDLGMRIHDHQSLAALGRMSAEILRTALDRLERRDRLVLTEPLASVLRQPARDAAGLLCLVDHPIEVQERPPLAKWRATTVNGRP
jgi:glucosyl-3-phosphoglycerate synthase